MNYAYSLKKVVKEYDKNNDLTDQDVIDFIDKESKEMLQEFKDYKDLIDEFYDYSLNKGGEIDRKYIKAYQEYINNFKAKKTVSSKDQERAKKLYTDGIINNIHTKRIFAGTPIVKDNGRSNESILTTLPEDQKEIIAKYLDKGYNNTDLEEFGMKAGEYKQKCLVDQTKKWIKIIKEGMNAMTDTEALDFVEKYGFNTINTLFELQDDNLKNCFHSIGVEMPKDIEKEWNEIRDLATPVVQKAVQVQNLATPMYNLMRPEKACCIFSMIEKNLENYLETPEDEIENEKQKLMVKLYSGENISYFNRYASINFGPVCDINFFMDDDKKRIFSQQLNFMSYNVNYELKERGFEIENGVPKGVKFFDLQKNEIKDPKDAYLKALNGEKIRLVDENNIYIKTLTSSYEAYGFPTNEAKSIRLKIADTARNAIESTKNEKDAGIRYNTIHKNIENYMNKIFKTIGREMDENDPFYVRWQINKDQGPYSKVLNNLQELIKFDKEDHEGFINKVAETNKYALEYLNSKLDKTEFNTLETKRFNAMDRLYQTFLNFGEEINEAFMLEDQYKLLANKEKQVANVNKKDIDIDKNVSIEKAKTKEAIIEKEKTK